MSDKAKAEALNIKRTTEIPSESLLHDWKIKNGNESFDEDRAIAHSRRTKAAFSRSVSRLVSTIVSNKR